MGRGIARVEKEQALVILVDVSKDLGVKLDTPGTRRCLGDFEVPEGSPRRGIHGKLLRGGDAGFFGKNRLGVVGGDEFFAAARDLHRRGRRSDKCWQRQGKTCQQ